LHGDPDAEDRPGERTLAWEIGPVVRGGDGRSRQTCVTRLPETYAYFEGHFPAYPVLAAAVQLHELVLPCVRRSRSDLGPLRHLKDLKFLERIGPGERLEVTLAWEEDAPQLAFEILADGVRASAGTLVLDGAGDAEPA
jgi:3-hydroxymyristoyl/3-hydroxydecanoyl-(acyl carrier protein) dehydratase